LKKKERKKANEKPLIIAITGTSGKTTTIHIVKNILEDQNLKVSTACTSGLYLNGKRIIKNDQSRKKAFNRIYKNSNKSDVILCEYAIRSKNKRLQNLYPEKSDICLITNIYKDPLYQKYFSSLKEVVKIKSSIIDHNKANGHVILNADNKHTLSIAENMNITNLILYTEDSAKISMLEKLKPKKIYFLKNNNIFMTHKNNTKLLIKNTNKIPITMNHALKSNITNIIAAIAILENIKRINFSKVSHSLKTLFPTYSKMPGRYNIYSIFERTVIVDCPQNIQSVNNLLKTVTHIPHKKIILLARPLNSDIDSTNELSKLLAKFGDQIYIKETFPKKVKLEDYKRGEAEEMLRSLIIKHGFPANRVQIIMDEMMSIKEGINSSREKDLIIIMGYKLAQINSLLQRMLRHRLNH
jgi:cyanophycin synthetase